MSEFEAGKSEMSTGVFVQRTLRDHIAPRAAGENVKDRIRYAARQLGWSYTRTKDAWYGDPRISISGEELRDVEEISGVTYARAEIRTNDQLIANAEVLLMGTDPDFHSAFTAGLRSFIGAFYRPRNRGN